ncbi:MAG: hypothetical protein ACJ8KO_07985, partial [Sulfurifustaceae bacterium]
PRLERDASGRVHKVWVSATTGAGMDLLIDAVAEHYRSLRRAVVLQLPPDAGRLRAVVYERLDVARETPLETGGWLLELALDATQLAWLTQQQDFQSDYIVADSPSVLAPTASLS